MERKFLSDSEAAKEHRALTSSVALQIFQAAMASSNADVTFLRNAWAILVSYVFFERGEAGISLLLDNVTVTHQSIDIAFALRKKRQRVAHPLSYRRSSRYSESLIDLVLHYDALRHGNGSKSRFYWALPGTRLSTSA